MSWNIIETNLHFIRFTSHLRKSVGITDQLLLGGNSVDYKN